MKSGLKSTVFLYNSSSFTLPSEFKPINSILLPRCLSSLKLLNTDRHYTSQLGLQLIQKYQTKIRLPLKPTDFTPPPAVPTVFFEAKKI